MTLFEISWYSSGTLIQIIKFFKQTVMKLEFELLLDSQYYHLEWMKKEHSLLEEPVLKM
jgi:hypothetical protein